MDPENLKYRVQSSFALGLTSINFWNYTNFLSKMFSFIYCCIMEVIDILISAGKGSWKLRNCLVEVVSNSTRKTVNVAVNLETSLDENRQTSAGLCWEGIYVENHGLNNISEQQAMTLTREVSLMLYF